CLVPGPAIPVAVMPKISRVIDHLAEAMHILDLAARGRVRYRPLSVDAVAIAGIGRTLQQCHEPAVLLRLHRLRFTVLQFQFHLAAAGRPHGEAHASIGHWPGSMAVQQRRARRALTWPSRRWKSRS